MDDGRRASSRFGNELELGFERGIFIALGSQAVSVAVNERNDIIQFVRNRRGNVACRVKFPGGFPQRACVRSRLRHYLAGVFQ